MTTFLSQGIDYLGFLEAKLRDLQGYATLAYELIQNADDAKASRIVFDVRDEALVVENTSLFSDCAQVEADECHWKALYGYRCDFHRFRKVASGDKRDQEETTGAFGIGFISVYQITDRPELQSGRRHWIIRPDEPEQQRIEVVPVSEHFEGTRFVLTWAIDPNTRLRQRLRTPTLSIPEAADAFTAALACNLPDAILFLKHVECIELRRHGELVKQIQRSSDGDQVVVQDGDSLHLWYILRGSFDTEAQRLRGQYPHQIEQKRTAFVTVAIPEDISKRRGRFCACLPTEQYTELPVYINADFYPSTDRKRILLTNDYQGQWNRAAITEAAKLIASAVPSLTQKFDHNSLWEFFNQIKKVADEAAAGHQDHVFRSFWQFTQASIENYPTVFIWPAGWKKPTEALLPEQSAKEDALNLWQADKQPLASSTEATLPEQSAKEDALNLWQAMGLSIVHPDLRPYFPLLRAVKVRVLSLADLVQALKQAGLNKTVALEQAPVWIRSRDARDALGCEIQRLSSQPVKRELLADAQYNLRQCAIALNRNNQLSKPACLLNPSEDVARILTALGQTDILLANDNPPAIAQLVKRVTPERMLDTLENIAKQRFARMWRENRAIIFGIVDWFANYRKELRNNEHLKRRLRKLPIWPSGDELFSLDELHITGPFEDPLGLATILHPDMQRNRQDFLRDLEVNSLTLENYAADLVPKALQDSQRISPEARRHLILLFARELSKLRMDPSIQSKLADCPLVECQDGSFQPARRVYFESEDVCTILNQPPLAQLPPKHTEAVRELYRWLGVAEQPSLEDVDQRINQIVAGSPTEENCQVIERIFKHLSGRQIASNDPVLPNLKSKRWLPSRDDRSRWFRPSELYAVYQDYLFYSQAHFLGLDHSLQQQARNFLHLLGVSLQPTLQQVISHLKWSIAEGREVNAEVYRYLNSHAEDQAVAQLRDSACLWLKDVGYVKPATVFWSSHQYGRYRHKLPEELREFSRLLAALGVREQPTPDDAMLVLQEIGAEYRHTRRPIDESTYQVLLTCWQQLNQALEQGEIERDALNVLRTLPVIPTDDCELRIPVGMFLEDRPDLAEKFDDFKGKATVPPILGCWQAMIAAGVQPLSKSIETVIVKRETPEPDNDLITRLRERRRLILRVLEAMRDSSQQVYDINLLQDLRVERVKHLTLEHILDDGTRIRKSRPVSVSAHFDLKRKTIYIQQQPMELPWPTIALAIAKVITQHSNPAVLATVLEGVLSESSVDRAEEKLNRLGYAQLVVPKDATLDEAGSHVDEPHNDLPSHASDTPSSVIPELSPEPTHPNGSKPTNEQQPTTVQIKDETTSPPSCQDHARPDHTKTEQNTHRAEKQVPRRQHQPKSSGRRRTYVLPSSSNSFHPPSLALRNKSERAGIELVLQFERAHGRYPNEMPPNTPGYDIVSRDSNGAVLRYIEVKSTAGEWDSYGIALSSTQFHAALEHKDRYWLYVVEWAGSPSARIYRIQDPARQVEQFLYDDGWRALTELDHAPDEEYHV